MGWRTVSIEKPAYLHLAQGSLVIDGEKMSAKLSIEDIDTLIVDNPTVKLTIKLVNALTSGGVAVILCDDKHLPATVALPLAQHSRHAKIARAQIDTTVPLKKQLWQMIIKQKIVNQAYVLQCFGHTEGSDDLSRMSSLVYSGDSTNRESVAARLYFAKLLNNSTRRQPILINSALDYGYAIIRSIIARSIAARGLVLSNGIFHRSELNSFNLADDILEPFRPFIDFCVLNKFDNYQMDKHLTIDDRHYLLDIINIHVIINGKQYTMHDAVDIVVDSFTKSIAEKTAEYMQLPQFK